MANTEKKYDSRFPGVNAFGGAVMSVTIGRGRRAVKTELDHVGQRTAEKQKSVCDTVKYLVGIK
jgi:hypothetical protein